MPFRPLAMTFFRVQVKYHMYFHQSNSAPLYLVYFYCHPILYNLRSLYVSPFFLIVITFVQVFPPSKPYSTLPDKSCPRQSFLLQPEFLTCRFVAFLKISASKYQTKSFVCCVWQFIRRTMLSGINTTTYIPVHFYRNPKFKFFVFGNNSFSTGTCSYDIYIEFWD